MWEIAGKPNFYQTFKEIIIIIKLQKNMVYHPRNLFGVFAFRSVGSQNLHAEARPDSGQTVWMSFVGLALPRLKLFYTYILRSVLLKLNR